MQFFLHTLRPLRVKHGKLPICFQHKAHEGNHKVHNKIGVSIVNFVEYL